MPVVSPDAAEMGWVVVRRGKVGGGGGAKPCRPSRHYPVTLVSWTKLEGTGWPNNHIKTTPISFWTQICFAGQVIVAALLDGCSVLSPCQVGGVLLVALLPHAEWVVFVYSGVCIQWSLCTVVFVQGGVFVQRSLGKVVFVYSGLCARWSLCTAAFVQGGVCVCVQWSLCNVVFVYNGLCARRRLCTVVFVQGGVCVQRSLCKVVFVYSSLCAKWCVYSCLCAR